MEIETAVCDMCYLGELKFVKADPPYRAEHYVCPVCDSTYAVEKELVFEADFDEEN
jgi:transposase-like protein